MTEMTKQQIKNIAQIMFNAGKNDAWDSTFDGMFETEYEKRCKK